MIVTPVGRIGYPYLTKVDSGREYSDKKYKVCLMWSKDDWKEISKEMQHAVLEVAKEAYGIKTVKFSQFRHPFNDGDERETPGIFEDQMYLTAKTGFLPEVVGPKKDSKTGKFTPLKDSDVEKIKGGDYARAVLDIYCYTQKGGGITVGLRTLQFANIGSALGAGQAEALSMLDEIDVELEDIDEEAESDNKSLTDELDDAISEDVEDSHEEDDEEVDEDDDSLDQFAA